MVIYLKDTMIRNDLLKIKLDLHEKTQHYLKKQTNNNLFIKMKFMHIRFLLNKQTLIS